MKATYSQFDNDFLVENLVQDSWVTDPTYSASYVLEEQIGAAYSALSWQISPTTGIKAGLRYEYTDTNSGTVTEPNIIDCQYGFAERVIRISYSRNFGNSGVKSARRRTTGSEEERGRGDN